MIAMPVDAKTVSHFLAEYFEAFAACVRGEREIATLLACYAVPLIITSDDGVTGLTTDSEVATVIQGQVDGLRALRYSGTRLLQSEVIGLNATSALFRASLSRYDDQGDEIDCPTITYVITNIDDGLRISMLAALGD
ncbi:hypothetical protein MGALJ_22780 [Mycobacterium gallinarum]|uniref:DUF6841 domain-containing protein n=1 Tax=Mycobacterium gallinarum TaxID=39689 RepID=A0A9W4BHT7_9MYCO|nr:hypothetical protein [Mycobacterium gallinarum]BBY92609.1 hypothetical protein MGALJ_22780 [Mycobacterium gallinarum]